MLIVSDVSVKFGKQEVLKHIDLALPEGTITGLVAPNGFGKTTLLRSIAGLVPSCKGQVTIDGIPPSKRTEYYRKLFFVEDASVLNPTMNPQDYLNLVKRVWRSDVDADCVIRTVRIGSFLRKPIGQLSLGMKQQVVIALCIMSKASYILLDEPMNGLDPTNTSIISRQLATMKADGKAILMSSHLLANIDDIADRVAFLKDGAVARLTQRENGAESRECYHELYAELETADYVL